MKKILAFLAAFLAAASLMAQNAWINEIHYDNTGTDADEFIEVIIENAGTYSLSDFRISLYNGNTAGAAVVYDSTTLDLFSTGATVGNFKMLYYVYPSNGIQNGTSDGVCLSYQGTPITGQLLSYEGVFTASNGPAAGMTSVDIGVSETTSTPTGQSLQLSGTGTIYGDFTWQPPATATMGQLNNGQVLGTYTPDPEPTNYPTQFSALGQGLSVLLGWTDATGAQLPAAYLIKASSTSTVVSPVDGTPEADDADLSDGKGAWNVIYGDQSFMWNGLAATSHYYFKIFPYTNYGQYIDYKTNGTIPSADAITQAIVKLYSFDDGLDPWTQYTVTGDQTWVHDTIHGIDGSGCAKMSGYSGSNLDNEDWLISPVLNLSNAPEAKLHFYSGENYGNGSNPLIVLISTDYSSGNPTTNGTWTDIGQDLTYSAGAWAWTPSGYVDISGYNQTNVHIAFKYTSTTSDAPTWEVDDVLITANSGVGINEPTAGTPAFEIYPNPCKNWFFLNIQEAGSYDISLVDTWGRKVINRIVQDGVTRIDVKSLNTGVYLVVVQNRRTGITSASRLIVR